VSAKEANTTIGEIKEKAKTNMNMAANSVLRTATTHLVTDGLQTSKFGMALGLGAVGVGVVAVLVSLWKNKKADAYIKSIQELVVQMNENEVMLEEGYKRLLSALKRIDPDFQAEYDRKWGNKGRA